MPYGLWAQNILNRTCMFKGDSIATLVQGRSIVELKPTQNSRSGLLKGEDS